MLQIKSVKINLLINLFTKRHLSALLLLTPPPPLTKHRLFLLLCLPHPYHNSPTHLHELIDPLTTEYSGAMRCAAISIVGAPGYLFLRANVTFLEKWSCLHQQFT